MKKVVFLCLSLWFICSCKAQLSYTNINGLWIGFELSNNAVSIVSISSGNSSLAILPDTISGSPITSIKDGAVQFSYKPSSFYMPNTVTNIGNSAFSGNSNLTNISFSTTLKNIGYRAFYGCSNAVINLPASVENIEEEAFANCSKITNLILSATNVGRMAFYNCDLYNLTLTDSVKKINSYTFSENKNLTNIYIGSGLSSLGSYNVPFRGSASLKQINVSSSNLYFSSEDGILYTKNKSELILYPANKNTPTYSLPTNTVNIQNYAFQDNQHLTQLNLNSAIWGIAYGALSGCVSLTNIYVPENNSRYSTQDGVLFNKAITELERYPPARTNKTYRIPITVIKLLDNSFSDSEQLETLNIPSNVTTIGSYAFSKSKKITNFVFEGSVSLIGGSAFNECSALEEIILPNGITEIPALLLQNSHVLKRVYIPESVNLIRQNAFIFNTNLIGIYFKGNAPSIEYGPVNIGSEYKSLTFANTNATVYFKSDKGNWSNKFDVLNTSNWVSNIDTGITISQNSSNPNFNELRIRAKKGEAARVFFSSDLTNWNIYTSFNGADQEEVIPILNDSNLQKMFFRLNTQ